MRLSIIHLVLGLLSVSMHATASNAQHVNDEGQLATISNANRPTLSETFNVSDNLGSSMFPRVTVDADGKLHLVWFNGGLGKSDILYAWWNGKKWSRPFNVSNDPSVSMFPDITSDSSGNVHVVWMDGDKEDSDIRYRQFSNGVWSDAVDISKLKGVSQRPQIQVDGFGTIHVIWFDNSSGFFELFHAQNKGDVWTKPESTKLVDWYITHNPDMSRRPSVRVDHDGFVHVVWVDLGDMSQNVFYSRWDGEAWSKRVNVSRIKDMRGRVNELTFASDASGNQLVAWDEKGIKYCRFDGKQWSLPANVAHDGFQSGLPAAALGNKGILHLAWAGMKDVAETQQIYYQTHDKNWSPPLLLSGKGLSLYPQIAVNDSDRVHVVWMDQSLKDFEIFHRHFSTSHWVGQKVMPKLDANFRSSGENKIPRSKIVLPIKVAQQKGKSLLFVSNPESPTLKIQGWTDVDAIVPLDEAPTYYTEYLNKHPKSLIALRERGIAWKELGQLNEAIADFTTVLELDPNDAVALNLRGNTLKSNGELDKALADLDQSLTLDPKNVLAINDRARIQEQKGDFDQTILDYDQSILLNPQQYYAYNNRGVAWSQKGEWDKAIGDYTEAIRVNPDIALAYTNRGLSRNRKRERDLAIEDFTQAMRIKPKDPKNFSGRGEAWFRESKTASAIKDLSEAIRLDPSLMGSLYYRGNCWLRLKKYDKAVEDFTEAGRLSPNSWYIFNDRAIARQKQGQYFEAVQDYKTAVQLAPKTPSVYDSLAWLLATCSSEAARDGALALEMATTACELTDWKDANTIETLAAAYAETDDFESAIKWIRKAIELDRETKSRSEMLKLFQSNKPYRVRRKSSTTE